MRVFPGKQKTRGIPRVSSQETVAETEGFEPRMDEPTQA